MTHEFPLNFNFFGGPLFFILLPYLLPMQDVEKNCGNGKVVRNIKCMCLLSTNAQRELFTEDKFNFVEIRQEKRIRNLI